MDAMVTTVLVVPTGRPVRRFATHAIGDIALRADLRLPQGVFQSPMQADPQ